MALSGILGTALTATTNPDPNTLSTKNPYPTPYVNARRVSAAWTSQGAKALFPTQASNGAGMVAIPVLFSPSSAGATFTATVWQYQKLSNTWFKHTDNPGIDYTGETGNRVINIYTDIPIFFQLASISTGTITIYFDNGLAYSL